VIFEMGLKKGSKNAMPTGIQTCVNVPTRIELSKYYLV
jgi:hypothetical protein